ncbi:putative disease resistance protein RGA4 [Vitis vinifera]|uniref:Putative disease resistance protein RGA4 n=1 Tax=Vitis vinifera TaxID=29760 RepID=A0A438FXH9_VITVI|nr:putative disease resistance protein RGA4 [Vitis vinifera]
MPYGIGELTLLQSLPLFVVGTGKAGDHKIGGLSELKRLNQLRGELRIRNLENVKDVVPVSRGEILKGKQYLRSLRLEWEWWDENGELVMEWLQPHPTLKDLFIQGYGDRRFPSWMLNDRGGGGSISSAVFPISSIPQNQLDAKVEGIVEDGVKSKAMSLISSSF